MLGKCCCFDRSIFIVHKKECDLICRKCQIRKRIIALLKEAEETNLFTTFPICVQEIQMIPLKIQLHWKRVTSFAYNFTYTHNSIH